MTVQAPVSPPVSPAPQAAAPANVKLTVPRIEALKLIRDQIEKGVFIKRARIRYVPDLERARQLKGEWTTAVMTLLKSLFTSDSIADDCQNWVGKVLPEYADLNLFIEHFYDEMDQRLRKLQNVMRKVAELPAEQIKPIVTAAPKTPAKPQAAPADSAATDAAASGDESQLAPDHPAAKPAAPAKRLGAILLGTEEFAPLPAVLDFASRLGFDMTSIPADPASGRLRTTNLDEAGRPEFVLICRAGEKPVDEFDLGYCVGRLGPGRVIVLSTCAGGATHENRGVATVPLDDGDAWQLHLARQLKRAGLEVDLNRVW